MISATPPCSSQLRIREGVGERRAPEAIQGLGFRGSGRARLRAGRTPLGRKETRR